MEQELGVFKQELRAAAGEIPADMILEHIKLVDVYTEEVREASLAVFNGKIVAIDPPPGAPCKEKVDGAGRYAVPGFMDAHVHIETTLLTPESLAEVIVPWGSTTLFVDAMEIANVAGMNGLLALVRDAEKLPFRIYLEIPSRVPTAPGLETAGAVLGLEEVRQLLALSETVSLGELDPSKITGLRDEYLEKIRAALAGGRICNGHAIGLTPSELNMYAAAHLLDDHECVTYEELLARLRVGIKAMVREGSSERNAEELMRGVIEHGLPTENLLFCTDDKHVNDIFAEGHISYNIQKAIGLGLAPVKAIKIATINAARHFHLEHLLGSLTPGRYADIVLLDSLYEMRPAVVFKGGKLVAEDLKALPAPPKDYPPELFTTVHIREGLDESAFRIPAAGSCAQCRVIALIADQIINREEHEWMPVEEGEIKADPNRDILKLAVVERHGKNGRVGMGLCRGFGLNRGALASSVSHDHHNIVVVGTNERDMLAAVQELARRQGGFAAACDGEILASLALPLAGLMSCLPAREVMQRMDALNGVAREMGCGLKAPFMTLSFISLPTVPELGLTDYGLIHVKRHEITQLILHTGE